METAKRILLILVKDPSIDQTVTSIANSLNMSRVGIWKVLKNLESQNIVTLKQLTESRTSTYIVKLNNSKFTIRNVELALAEEAQQYERWIDTFNKINAGFIVLFGSILHSHKDAGDIDILVVAKKENINNIEETIRAIQKSQIKHIHATIFTVDEFRQELKDNKIIKDAIKKGIVLSGQDKFVEAVS
jgi:predicted transcriptional regulator